MPCCAPSGAEGDAATRALASGMTAIIIRCNFYWSAMAATGTLERAQLTDGLARITHRLFHGPIPGVNLTDHDRKGVRRRPRNDPFDRPVRSEQVAQLRPRGLATRRRILAAGAQVLPTRGYHNARVDDIVASAEVSHGTFYRYFPDKDAFFRALAEEATTGMIELLAHLPLDGDRDALTDWLGRWFESYRENGGVITTWQEMQESEGDLVEFSQQVALSVVSGLMSMLEDSGHDDALFDTLVLLALIERLPYRTFTLGYTSAEAAIEAGVTIIRRAVLGLAD